MDGNTKKPDLPCKKKQLVLFPKENGRLSLCTSTFLASHTSLCLTYLIKSVHHLKPQGLRSWQSAPCASVRTNPQAPWRKAGVGICICSLSAGEYEAGRSLKQTTQTAWQNWWSLVRVLSQKTSVWAAILRVDPLLPQCAPAPLTCVYPHTKSHQLHQLHVSHSLRISSVRLVGTSRVLMTFHLTLLSDPPMACLDVLSQCRPCRLCVWFSNT